MNMNSSRSETRWMTALSGLFFLRVLGQLCVGRRRASFLPPMEQWQSGLLPYPALLTAQGVILAAHAAIDIQSGRGRITPRPRIGRRVRFLSVVYFASMMARYVVSMRRHPERRWFGKTIPIVFHCILATHLFLFARILRKSGPR
jgi:uncharacterized protein